LDRNVAEARDAGIDRDHSSAPFAKTLRFNGKTNGLGRFTGLAGGADCR
jgi:hypothetical protein